MDGHHGHLVPSSMPWPASLTSSPKPWAVLQAAPTIARSAATKSRTKMRLMQVIIYYSRLRSFICRLSQQVRGQLFLPGRIGCGLALCTFTALRLGRRGPTASCKLTGHRPNHDACCSGFPPGSRASQLIANGPRCVARGGSSARVKVGSGIAGEEGKTRRPARMTGASPPFGAQA